MTDPLAAGAGPAAGAALPRWRVVPALAIGTLMATLDISAVNLALPTLSRSFRVPLTTVEWVVLAYVITVTSLLLLCGRLADRWGRRRVYGAGLGVFTVASALCAAAPGAHALFAARALQGLGAAMMTANSSALLVSSFPPAERGRALGAFGATVGVGLAAGPALGGFLIGTLSWRWIFLVNLPLGLLAAHQLRRRVPPDRPRASSSPLDLPGAVLGSLALLALMLGLSLGPGAAWSGARVWGCFAAAAVLGVAFAIRETRAPAPLLPLRLLLGPLGAAALLTLIAQALSMAIGIHMPLYLEDVLGWDAVRAGRWLAIVPLTALVLAPLVGRASDRWGTRAPSVLGLAIAAAALATLAGSEMLAHPARLSAGLVLFGVGLALFTVPNASALLDTVPPEQLGLASGLQATMRNLGISGGAALTTAAVASRYAAHGGGRLAAGRANVVLEPFVAATHDLYLGLTALAVVGLALAWRRGRPPRKPTQPAT